MAHPPATSAPALESTDRRAAQEGEVHIGTGLLHGSGRDGFPVIQSSRETVPQPLVSNLARRVDIQVLGVGRGAELVTLLRDGHGMVGMDGYGVSGNLMGPPGDLRTRALYDGSGNLVGWVAIQVPGRHGEPFTLLRDSLGTVAMDEYGVSGNLLRPSGDLRSLALYDNSVNLAGLTLVPAAGRDEGAGAVSVDIGGLERHVGADVDVVQRHPVVVRAEGVLDALRDVSRSLGAAGESFRGLADEIRAVFHSFSTAVGHVRGLLLNAVWIIMALSTAVRVLVAGAGSPVFVFLLLIVGVVLVILHMRRA